MPRKASDYYDDLSLEFVGSISTTTRDGIIRGRKPREFAPGFHGANPGPSHEDEEPKPRKKTTNANPGTRSKGTARKS